MAEFMQKKVLKVVALREKFAMEALIEQKRWRSQSPCAICDGGIHQQNN